jgi:hypothetical protein
MRTGQKRTTYDGGSLVLVELLLEERDAEGHAEEVYRVAGPGKISNDTKASSETERKWKHTQIRTGPIGPT